MAVISEEMRSLMAEKDRLEQNIQAMTDFLTAPNQPGLTGNLIDDEGFPRADIDMYAVRDARNKIARWQNDHKDVMKKIENQLFKAHSETRISVPIKKAENAANGSGGENASLGSLGHGPVFAVIDQVFADSPAEKAGLLVDDKLKKFGNVDLVKFKEVGECFKNLRTEVVEDVSVQIVVERNGAEVMITLTPQKWAGQGMLGCHLVPHNM